MPLRCANDSAPAMLSRIRSASPGGIPAKPDDAKRCFSVSPGRYSIVMNTMSPSRSQSITRTMCGCARLWSLSASRWSTASEAEESRNGTVRSFTADVRIVGARLRLAAIDRLVDAAHAAFADVLHQLEAAEQHRPEQRARIAAHVVLGREREPADVVYRSGETEQRGRRGADIRRLREVRRVTRGCTGVSRGRHVPDSFRHVAPPQPCMAGIAGGRVSDWTALQRCRSPRAALGHELRMRRRGSIAAAAGPRLAAPASASGSVELGWALRGRATPRGPASAGAFPAQPPADIVSLAHYTAG